MSTNNHLQPKNNIYLGVFIKSISTVLLVLALTGCAHTISKGVLEEVDKSVSFEKLINDPEQYQGKMVLLGGVIIKTENKQDGTLIEVYQTELDYYGKPINTDVSKGRFLALYNEFLDSEIYSKGREVTIAGIVKGQKVIKLGEIDYSYPYLVAQEVHLWKEEQPRKYSPYHLDPLYPFWWYPWYRGYGPYFF